MAITWDENMFRKYYRLPNASGQLTTYSRIGWRYYTDPHEEWGYTTRSYPDHPINEYRHRVEHHLVQEFPILPTSRVLVLGCGSGFLPETFIWWMQQNGQTLADAQSRVAGIDNSAFIQANIASEAHEVMQGKIINRSLLDGAAVPGMRNALRTAAGGSEFFDFVITESVIESYTAAERTNFLDKCQSYCSGPPANVIHITCDGWDAEPDGGSPALTLEEWAATRPAHSWMSYNGRMRAIPGV